MVRKIFDLIGNVLNVDPSQITDQTTQDDIKNWDSLNSLLLIDEIENEYNIKISIDEIIQIKSVSDIKKILKNNNIDTAC